MTAPAFVPPSYTYRVEVVRVIDGDTVDVNIDVGFKTTIFKRLRFLGVDTWELRGEEKEKGKLAKARLEQLIAEADDIYVQTKMDATGKYGRVLAWLWTKPASIGDVICVNEVLLEEGHGEPA